MMKSFKKIFAAALVIMLLCAVLAGCSQAEKKQLKVGFDAEFPPYGYLDTDGEYKGFDLDLAQEVCNRLGWKLVKQPIDWDFKDMNLESGLIDCIWNGFTMTGREDDYTWTKPYVDNSQVFIVKADSGIKSQADLAGKTVAVQADSSALSALKDEKNADLKASFKSIVQVGDYNTAFMNLEAGSVDAIVVDVGVADYQIASRGNAYVKLEKALATEQYAIGFKLGNTALRDKIEKVFDEVKKDGTFLKLAQKWGLEDCVIVK